MQSLTGREAEFARRLSVSDKVSRDRALKKMRTWLHARSQPAAGDFDAEEMLKLWRGLHYCMWMSDKPLVQEECAQNIASLVHSMATDFCALQFVDCGWLTLCQEWLNIDRLRMDKFMMMMRHYLRQNFAYLQKHQWRPALVDEMMRNFSLGIMDPEAEDVPLGVQLHLTDIYVPVLGDLAVKAAIPWTVLQKLLRPLFVLAAKTNRPVVLKATCAGIRDTLLQLSSVFGQQMDTGDAESDAEAEESPLKVDHGEIGDTLFQLGSDSSVLQKNRTVLYMLKRQFDTVATKYAGSSSSSSPSKTSEERGKDDCASADAAGASSPSSSPDAASVEESMEEGESAETVPTKKRRKKRRRKASDSPSSLVESQSPVEVPLATPAEPESIAEGSPVKKKKLRLSLENTQVKRFWKGDPIDVSPWTPTAKEGKSLLKNRTPTPITPKMQRLLARSRAKTDS